MGTRDVHDHQVLLHFFMAKEEDEGRGGQVVDPGGLMDVDRIGCVAGRPLEGQPPRRVATAVGQNLFQAKSDSMSFLCRNLEGRPGQLFSV